jgi:hypothetical protein
MASFVRLTTRLSIQFPETNFVIRPHPAEDVSFYQSIFAGVDNVHVVHEGSTGAWLFACRCIIQDGCTTGIEAHLADVPINTYKNLVDERYDLFLPNLFGARCTSEEETAEYLHELLFGEKKRTGVTNSEPSDALPEQAHAMNANFRQDAFVALTRLIHEQCDSMPAANLSYHPGRYAALETMRQSLRSARAGLQRFGNRPTCGKAQVFYGFDKAGVPEKMERVQAVLSKPVKYSLLNAELILVESD